MPITKVQENASAKKERLEIRVTRDQKTLIEHAAAVNGRSTTDFVVGAAQEVASRTLQEHETMKLSMRDREAFAVALIDPPAPSARLKSAVKHYKKVMSR